MQNHALERKAANRKTGNLTLFGPSSDPSQPHGRFKVTRGFIDDLNRVLPIRLRIQLEGEIGKGGLTGRFQTGQVGYSWEFQPQ